MQWLSNIQRYLLHFKFQNLTHWVSKCIWRDEDILWQINTVSGWGSTSPKPYIKTHLTQWDMVVFALNKQKRDTCHWFKRAVSALSSCDEQQSFFEFSMDKDPNKHGRNVECAVYLLQKSNLIRLLPFNYSKLSCCSKYFCLKLLWLNSELIYLYLASLECSNRPNGHIGILLSDCGWLMVYLNSLISDTESQSSTWTFFYVGRNVKAAKW